MHKNRKIILGISAIVVIILFFYINYSTDFTNSISNISQLAKGSIPESVLSVVTLPPAKIELLGKAEVSYAGGVINRNNNIELGIARINGTIVHPGEEFSFLKTLGPVLETDGFKEAKSFYNGEVVLGLGGGLCHVSTTLFQSLVYSGLPITERHNHTFTVPYYKTGLDATISSSGPDLKFINDTKYDITIKGYTQNKVAIFEIYGVKDGRIPTISDVEIFDWKNSPPTQFIPSRELAPGEKKCEQSNQGGFSAKRIYEVLYPTGETRQQIFESTYQPLHKICQIGVNDSTDFTGCNSVTLYSRVTGVRCPKNF